MTRPPPSRAADPEAQERAWQDFVSALRSGTAPPFEEQWAVFQRVYAGRRLEDGPPPAWRPGAETLTGSNLGRFMRELGFDDYRDLHAWSARERAEFWRRAIERLGIAFARPPRAVLGSSDVRHPNWLAGAELNCVDSCFRAEPSRTAIVSGGEGTGGALRTTTYGELERAVNAFAGGLRAHGFREGDGIALYMPMTVECVVAYLGAVRSGCRVISIADSFAPAELRRRLEIGDARGIVTVADFLRGGKRIDLYAKVRRAEAPRAIVIPGAIPDAGLRAGDLRWDDVVSNGREHFHSAIGDPYRVTNVLFSSGTTGDPKAIPWTHLTPIKCAMDGHFHQDIRPDDVVAWPTNIGWMMGPWLIYATLVNGAAMALFDGLPTGPAFARFVRDAGVTVLGTVPSLVRAWRAADCVPDGLWDRVRVFSSTGEPSNREDYLWLMSRTGYRAPVIEYCGGTEIGGGYITGTVVQPASPATFSTPALGLDFVILDDAGRPVPEGGEGELFLVPPSIGLSETLLNRDHDTVYYAGCPAGPGGVVLRRHGDQMARLGRGYYRAQGRADDTMNLGGIKVSSRELEAVLDGHDAVYESAAVAVRPGGEGADRLVVYAVVRDEIDPERLRRELGALIADRLNPLFKIHDLVLVDSLPRTASNKLMRRALRERWARGRS